MTINLHIERIILDGLPLEAHHGPIVRAAIEAELARLLAAQGLPPALHAGGALPALRAAPIAIADAATPDAIGQQIARSVYGGLGEPR